MLAYLVSAAVGLSIQSAPNFQADFDAAARVWVRCVETNAANFAKQPEGADVLADAAFGACNSEETKARTAAEVMALYQNSGKGISVSSSQKSANLEFDQMKIRARTIIIAQIIKNRSTK